MFIIVIIIAFHQAWHVIIQTRQRLDLHTAVGTSVSMDLVVRGDRFARRARAHASSSTAAAVAISFTPEAVFQLVSGAYNRVVMNITPRKAGVR